MIGGVEFVFDKVWGRGDHLSTRIENRFQDHIERPGGAAGHDDLVFGELHPVLTRQVVGDRSPDVGITGIRHVTVPHGPRFRYHSLKSFFENIGGVQVRIAETEVIDIFGPVLGFQLGAFLEHLPDPRRPGHHGLDFLCNTHCQSLPSSECAATLAVIVKMYRRRPDTDSPFQRVLIRKHSGERSAMR